jgi:uncharacterized protein (UPF0335 family)
MYTGTKILEVDNQQDVIDSRDIIARIEELEEEREPLQDAIDEAQEEVTNAETDPENMEALALRVALTEAKVALDEWDACPEGKELKVLKALAEECEGCGDWANGETLIRDSYFESYAQDLAEDCCDIPGGLNGLHWPLTCIDWEQAATELKQDYMCIDYDGVDYWLRA